MVRRTLATDILATVATGTGKTDLYCFLMLVIHAVSQDPNIALNGMTLPRNPCMLLISPTVNQGIAARHGLVTF